MLKTTVYKCPFCNVITVVPVKSAVFATDLTCNICKLPMKRLSDDFDLSEVIEEYCDTTCANKTGDVEEP